MRKSLTVIVLHMETNHYHGPFILSDFSNNKINLSTCNLCRFQGLWGDTECLLCLYFQLHTFHLHLLLEVHLSLFVASAETLSIQVHLLSPCKIKLNHWLSWYSIGNPVQHQISAPYVTIFTSFCCFSSNYSVFNRPNWSANLSANWGNNWLKLKAHCIIGHALMAKLVTFAAKLHISVSQLYH